MRPLFLLLTLLSTAAFADPLFIAVGYGGRRIASHDGITWENDQRWSDVAADDDNVLFNVAFGAGRFVAVGGGAAKGRIVTTRDGRDWTELPPLKGRVATVAFGDGHFVAAHDGELLASPDGETFTAGAKLDWAGSIHARRSAYGDTEAGKMFVIIGDVDLFGEGARVSWRATTSDGATFASAAHHTAPARDIAYGAGHFVVVGPGGLVETSHDGQMWKRCEGPGNEDFQRIVWTGQRFLVSGGPVAWSSPDGLAWSAEKRGIPCSLAWAREPAAPLALGFSWGGNLHLSTDFAAWKKIPLPPGPSFEAVAFRP